MCNDTIFNKGLLEFYIDELNKASTKPAAPGFRSPSSYENLKDMSYHRKIEKMPKKC